MMLSSLVRRLVVTAVIVSLAGCKMDVVFPSVIDASTFDPSGDAATISLSAQSNLYRALHSMIPFSAVFSQEAWVGAVRQETNDIGRRVMTAATSDVNSALWTPLQRAIATNELAIQVLAQGSGAASDINVARAYMNSGFALVLLAEHFCTGAFLVGPPLSPAQVLDTAITRFTAAVTAGAAAAARGIAEGTKVVNAANVGLARAHLQKKSYPNAVTAAALVPASFVYSAITVDDASNRGLGNGVFSYDQSALLIVPDVYRALGDPRVAWRDAGRRAQDTQFQYYQQLKHAGWATPIRIASGLEASYIAAEARLQMGDPTAATTLIAARRAANGQPAFAGTGAAAILAELMDQRAREFWLEAKHTGDAGRNPTATPYRGAAGATFYKPAQGTYGSANCLPVPLAEVNANPNFPKG
ncbi:MAG: RagB/SusD family nutrient uptake outer membrane protein [Gemmatimonadaceae bacterium]